MALDFYLSVAAAAIWLIVLLLPWRPWSVKEALEADFADDGSIDLSDITVVIPARNEAEVIATTLSALARQGRGLKAIVVDDDSSDGTAAVIKQSHLPFVRVIESKSLPNGWTGKLWAQEQGLKEVRTTFTMLLDADIALQPGMINSLKAKLLSEQLHFVSLMAVLRFETFWEKLLMPAFVYFFKMVYPFGLANKQGNKLAAAAGGCIFAETAVLRNIGGLSVIKDALIDDCTLAKKVKSSGYKTWIGLTHGVVSQRSYMSLMEIWEMVARTAYTQLRYSIILLLACTFLMLMLYWLPVYGLLFLKGTAFMFNAFAILVMLLLYVPVLRFYSFNPVWSLVLPLIAGLYLLMTWTSALRCWKGERSRWKGRIYHNDMNTL